jgi:hypothetical protein
MKLIPLTQGLFAMVDDQDFAYLSQFKWRAHKSGRTTYARREINGTKKSILLHRELLGSAPGDIAHADHNGLNNQRGNISIVTHKENAGDRRDLPSNNTSGVWGVSMCKYVGVRGTTIKWRAKPYIGGKCVHLGMFNTLEEAAMAILETRNK